MPRSPIVVTLDDGKQHRILDGEVTACGQVVPMGLDWQAEIKSACPVCFPEGTRKARTNLTEAQAVENPTPEPEPAADAEPTSEEPVVTPDETPAKPTKAATKRAKKG